LVFSFLVKIYALRAQDPIILVGVLNRIADLRVHPVYT
jgi:hypothetical protein